MVHSLARQPARPARLATVAVSSEMTFVVMAMAAGAAWSHGGLPRRLSLLRRLPQANQGQPSHARPSVAPKRARTAHG
jgi:hypothetical protein